MSAEAVWIIVGIVILCLLISVGLLAHSIKTLLGMCWPNEDE